MKNRIALVVSAFLFVIPAAQAATTKPTPKPSTKISTKVVQKAATTTKSSAAKAPAKATAKSAKKPVAKSTTKTSSTKTSSTKATTKKTATAKAAPKKVVKKKVVKKRVRVSPSPKPKWPPAGFYTDKSSDSDVYARIPSTKELIGVISAKASLSQRIAECEKFACGAVQVASYIGCSWWEVTSTLYDTEPDKSRKVMGTLRTLVGKSAPQQILTILLISQESVDEGHIIDNISVLCHRDTPTEDFPQYSYSPVNS